MDYGYYCVIKNDQIVAKRKTISESWSNETPITKEMYDQLIVPSTFELDSDGNMINITPLPIPEPEPIIVDEEIDEEKIAMAEAIIDLNMRIEELENRLNGGV